LGAKVKELLTVALGILALTASRAAAQESRPDSLALARTLTQWLYTGRADSLWAHTSAEMKKNMGSPDAFKELTGNLVSNVGTEVEVENERFIMRQGKPQYWRVARFNLLQEDLLIRLVIVNGELTGMGFGEAWDAPPVDKPKKQDS
jgi:hypothetical protein